MLAATLALGVLLAGGRAVAVVEALRQRWWLELLGATLFGAIPNCAASVALAEGYVRSVLSLGATVAGLSAAAGYGPILLLQEGEFGTAGRLLGLCLLASMAAGVVVNAVF